MGRPVFPLRLVKIPHTTLTGARLNPFPPSLSTRHPATRHNTQQQDPLSPLRLRFAERFLEFLVDLLGQLPTRRFLKACDIQFPLPAGVCVSLCLCLPVLTPHTHTKTHATGGAPGPARGRAPRPLPARAAEQARRPAHRLLQVRVALTDTRALPPHNTHVDHASLGQGREGPCFALSSPRCTLSHSLSPPPCLMSPPSTTQTHTHPPPHTHTHSVSLSPPCLITHTHNTPCLKVLPGLRDERAHGPAAHGPGARHQALRQGTLVTTATHSSGSGGLTAHVCVCACAASHDSTCPLMAHTHTHTPSIK